MPATILSDNGASSGTAGLKTSGSNDGILELQTTTSGGTATAAITIDTAQRSKFPTTIGVGGATPSTSGSGITFPGTQSASTDANTLDDYEEGTWTPTYTTTGTNFTSVTYDAAITAGRYTKIGNMVYVQGGLRTDAITVGSASGIVSIGGLPFTVRSFPTRASISLGITRDFAGDAPLQAAAFEDSVIIILFYRTSVNANNLDLAPSDLGTGADQNRLEFSGCYLI